jgi:RNA polymerase sigma-70 factor (ECF subfamily)
MADPSPPSSDFAAFYRRTLTPLRRYLARFTGGSQTEAQDIAHDAYARVYPAMQSREIERPQAFLYTTARHLALDRLKHETRSPFEPATPGAGGENAASSAPGVESVVMAREEWALLEDAIAGLPQGCRRVFLLRMADRLSHEEIAGKLGLARSSVEKHLMRAMRLLHEAMHRSTNQGAAVFPLNSKTGSAGR